MRIGVDIDNTVGQTIEDRMLSIAGIAYPLEAVKYGPSGWPSFGHVSEEDVRAWADAHPEADVDLPLYPGASAALRLLLDNELWFITARDASRLSYTEKWINNNTLTHIVLHIGVDEKARFCVANDVDVMIEDDPSKALNCAVAGVHVLLFDKHYNRGAEHPLITRFSHWIEVPRLVRSIGEERSRRAVPLQRSA